jgi:hypothetical protein
MTVQTEVWNSLCKIFNFFCTVGPFSKVREILVMSELSVISGHA